MLKNLRNFFQGNSREELSRKALNAAAAGKFDLALDCIIKGGNPNYIGDALYVSGWGSKERLQKDNIAHILLRCRQTEAFVQLLGRGLDPNLSFPGSDHFLCRAVSDGDAEAVKALILHGIDLSDVAGEKGALTMAYDMGRFKIAQLISSEYARRQNEVAPVHISLQRPLKLPPPLKLKKKKPFIV